MLSNFFAAYFPSHRIKILATPLLFIFKYNVLFVFYLIMDLIFNKLNFLRSIVASKNCQYQNKPPQISKANFAHVLEPTFGSMALTR